MGSGSVAEPPSIPVTSTPTSSRALLTSWPTSNSVMNASIGTGFTRSHPSNVTTDRRSATPAATTVETTTHSTRVPGENGIPTCAYVVAADIGPRAACSEDYCNCDGTVAPLLSTQVSVGGTWSSNCAYTAQPTTDSCPPETPVQIIILETDYVDPICAATKGGGETCGYVTVTSITSEWQ